MLSGACVGDAYISSIMECDNLDSIDAYLIQQCRGAEYCVINEKPGGTEYIVRVKDRVYVMIIPEDYAKPN